MARYYLGFMTSDRFSICMYTPSAFGGHARYTHEILSALAARDQSERIRVSLITSRDLAPEYRTNRYRIHDILPPILPRSAFRSPVTWGLSRAVHYYNRESTFLRWVEKHRSVCDAVHFQEYTMWLAPKHLRSLKARGVRLYFTVHNVYPHRYLNHKLKSPFSLRLSMRRTSLRLCDVLFVHTENLREQLAEFLGGDHPPIVVTPHGVWTSSDAPCTITAAEERVNWRHLLFFGVTRRNKGLHTLLRAMKGLDDCTLTVAGRPEDPRYQEQIQAMVRQLPPGQVELIDRFVEVEEMSRIFGQSSLVVLPYISFAAQSGVLHDALAYRLPVVATDVGALGESVQRWGIGQVVPPENDVALAKAIREMLTPHRYVQAATAVDRVRTDLSWDRSAEIMVEAYRSTLRES
jgi:glycosyltransferase involved in cell wall biosynthesis